MAINRWRGDAQGRAQVDHVTPANVEVGDTFGLTINRKDVSYQCVEPGDTEANLVARVCAGLVAAINSEAEGQPGEFLEVTATLGLGDDGVADYVILTGPTDGTPISYSTFATDAGAGQVDILTTVEGVAPLNEIQRVRLGGSPTGGTFTLTFAGQTTGAIAYNANAATVTTALEALSNIAAGDVTVVELATSDWTVEFKQVYAETDVPLVSGSGASLTGGCAVSVSTTQNGGPLNEIQEITNGDPATTATFRIVFNGVTSSLLSYQLTAAQFQTILEAMSSIGAGNVTVSRTTMVGLVTYRVTFTGAQGGINQPLMAYDVTPAGGLITEIQAGATRNEKQQVTLTGGPTGGTFTLTFEGATTAGINYNANNAAVVSALEGLANIGVGDVAVTGGPLPGTAVTVEFQAALANSDRQQMTGSGASLTGGSVNVSVTQEAVAGVNERQQVSLASGTTGGTFTLTYAGQTTGAINYNATANDVDTALEALSNIGAGDVTVTGGPGPGVAWTVEFTGALAKTNVVAITGDGANLTTAGSQTLTLTPITTPTGPNWYSAAENWSLGTAPQSSDTLVFEGAVSCLYGLEDLPTITPEVIVPASFEASIGLEDYNEAGSYLQYRPTHLKGQFSKVTIGGGDGNGPTRVRLNYNTASPATYVSGGGSPETGQVVQVKGSGATADFYCYEASLGIAVGAGESAAIRNLNIGYEDQQESDATVVVGTGCTQLTNIVQLGGNGLINLPAAVTITSIIKLAGTLLINGEVAVTTFKCQEGIAYWNSTGTCATLRIGTGGQVLLHQDMRPKAITNTFLEAGATLRDPARVATWANGITLDNCSLDEVEIDVGTHITLTVSAGP